MSLNNTKIVFTGSVGAGKTLAVNQLSDVSAISTGLKSSESEVLDHAVITLRANEKLYLYDTSSQKRFDFMSPILCKGAQGMIILIDNSQENPLQELEYYLNLYARFLITHPAVIGVTHADESDALSLQDYQAYLDERGESFPVMYVDARVQRDVLSLLYTLVNEIEKIQHIREQAYKLYA